MSLLAALLVGALAPDGAIAAVDSCLAATQPTAMKDAALIAGGWSESKIENIEKAKGDTRLTRLFSKQDAGAVIVVNINTKSGTPHCHVMARRSLGELSLLQDELAKHLSARSVSLDPNHILLTIPDRDVIVMLSHKPEGDAVLADIHLFAFDPKDAGRK